VIGRDRSMAAMPSAVSTAERCPRLVALAVVPTDKAALSPRDLVGQQARDGWWRRQLGHQQPVLRRLGQLDQDLVVCSSSARARSGRVELGIRQLGKGGRWRAHACCSSAIARRLSVGPGKHDYTIVAVIRRPVRPRCPPVSSNRAPASSDGSDPAARARFIWWPLVRPPARAAPAAGRRRTRE